MGDVSLDYSLTNGTTADAAQVMADLNEIVTALNDLDEANLGSALAAVLGVSQTGAARRGKSIIATEESTSSSSFTTLATPDRVDDIVLPTDGLLLIGYQALWKSDAGANDAGAAIFLGANQLKVQRSAAAAPAVQEVALPGTSYSPLFTTPAGLASYAMSLDASQVTTGQILGGPRTLSDSGGDTTTAYEGGLVAVFAAAGTYDVSVQFKVAPGTTIVYAKSRKLWVQAVGF